MPDPMIAPDQALHLQDVQPLDASWRVGVDSSVFEEGFMAGRIGGARRFDLETLSDRSTSLPHMLPPPHDLAAALGGLGLTPARPVLIYEQHGMFAAPRCWWTLRALGWTGVHILSGGMPAWRAAGGAIESGPPVPAAPSPAPSTNAPLVGIADRAAVAHALETGSRQVLDARPSGRFLGNDPEPRAGLRRGHMPGAINIPFPEVLEANGADLASAGAIADAFRLRGASIEQPTIVSCGSGVTAAILAAALARCGNDDVLLYDGSWAEWGGRADCPVETQP